MTAERLLFASALLAGFLVLFEACLAWFCASLTRISDASLMRSVRLLLLEALIPVPVAGIIGYAVAHLADDLAGFRVGLLCGVALSAYLFLSIARSVYETSYARAALFCLVFLAGNVILLFPLSVSPTANQLREAIINLPK
jgi:hypothetical protein